MGVCVSVRDIGYDFSLHRVLFHHRRRGPRVAPLLLCALHEVHTGVLTLLPISPFGNMRCRDFCARHCVRTLSILQPRTIGLFLTHNRQPMVFAPGISPASPSVDEDGLPSGIWEKRDTKMSETVYPLLVCVQGFGDFGPENLHGDLIGAWGGERG